MQLSISTAALEQIRETASWGIISGVTADFNADFQGRRRHKGRIQEFASIVDGPISSVPKA